jgi:hypothetical protein
MEGLVGLGQRSGWSEVRQVVENRALFEERQGYERFFSEEPTSSRGMRSEHMPSSTKSTGSWRALGASFSTGASLHGTSCTRTDS